MEAKKSNLRGTTEEMFICKLGDGYTDILKAFVLSGLYVMSIPL